MTDETKVWEEDDSATFIALGDVFTPSRDEQFGLIASLVPAGRADEFAVVDLACGAGALTEAILRRFPRCHALALDGSPRMLAHARVRLAEFGQRVHFGEFDLRASDWFDSIPDTVRCVVSSLAIHHLDGLEKQQLFKQVFAKLPSGGALLIADLVEPVNPYAWSAYGDAWDAAVRAQSVAASGNLAAYQRFHDGWNHYRDPDLEFDKPSGLFEQLRWLASVGFAQVDCFWLRAGHAIYGGYK